MIIGFYPGLGGSRYLLYLRGKKEFESNIAYDKLIKERDPATRYLANETVGLPNKDIILTHCVNVPMIKKHFPGHQVTIICGPLKEGLLDRKSTRLNSSH